MNKIHIFNSQMLLAEAIAEYFCTMISQSLQRQDQVYIALSGGTTPLLFFKALINLKTKVSWEKVHIFWVDERCVNPDDPESNYGMTKKNLLDKIDIPGNNVHRILGEAEPGSEVERYSQEIKQIVGLTDSWPVFDWILLGLGEDGHTASLFPHSPVLRDDHSVSALARHPETGRQRITLTLPVLNRGKNISFLVSGSSKKRIIREILRSPKNTCHPAARVNPVTGNIDWFLDKDAAEDLS